MDPAQDCGAPTSRPLGGRSAPVWRRAAAPTTACRARSAGPMGDAHAFFPAVHYTIYFGTKKVNRHPNLKFILAESGTAGFPSCQEMTTLQTQSRPKRRRNHSRATKRRVFKRQVGPPTSGPRRLHRVNLFGDGQMSGSRLPPPIANGTSPGRDRREKATGRTSRRDPAR